MDTTLLVETQFEEGKKLLEKLDSSGRIFPIALWMNSLEKNDWIMLLGVPKLKTTGSKDVFKLIHEIIIKNNLQLSLNDISLTDTTSEISQGLKSTIKTGFAISKINFFGNFINGHEFPDSIIYRVN